MRIKHVHKGMLSTWEVTSGERKKGKLYVDKFEHELAFRITIHISLLKKYEEDIKMLGVKPKEIHVYGAVADRLNRLLRDYKKWYHHTNKKK